jgi:4-hydroxybenzoate polyprenyltransferase
MTRRDKLLAYAQLLRLPNVFTAFADIALGACAAGYAADRPEAIPLLLLASGCLYLSGMAWNDWFDRRDDARDRPFRPIPSGRVSAAHAAAHGAGLMVIGVCLGCLAAFRLDALDSPASAVALGLAVAILAYNGVLKRTPLGPLGMGLCRSLNVLLGFALLPTPVAWHLAAVIGGYIVGVTWFARTEETTSKRRQLLLAAGVMLLAAVSALLVPLHRTEPPPAYFPYLLVAAGFWVGVPISNAIRRPDPNLVQAAVKRCIFGLVALDAVLATAFVGWPGLGILLLLLPAVYLGRWVYST